MKDRQASEPFNEVHPSKSTRGAPHTLSEHVACEDCALDPVCKPIPMGTAEPFSYILDNMKRRDPIAAGQLLYNEGSDVSEVYAITSGCLKLSTQRPNGSYQVTGFRMPGELVGDEVLGLKTHRFRAEAVCDSAVCRISISDIEAISQHLPLFQQAVLSLMTNQCRQLHLQLSSYVAHANAESKVAAFLLNVSERRVSTEQTTSRVPLPMSRSDIANFLGLRPETLSRTLSKFQKQSLIEMQGKTVHLVNVAGLKSISEQ